MLCALATLVTVPVLLSSGGSGEEIAAVVVPETVTASQLEADVDIDELFNAGAKLDDASEMPAVDRSGDAALAAEAVAAAPQRVAVVDPQGAPRSEEQPASGEPSSSTTSPAPPTTPVPQPTTPPVTAAPATAAPATAPPTTAAPITAAPTSAAESEPTTTLPAEDPVVEAPQSAEPAASAPTPEQWAALRQCEASGNYSIVSSNGRYHGAYQFYQPTWDGLARQVGRADLVGLAPSQASPADQDALALLLWQQRGNQPWPHCGRHLPAGP